MNSHIPRRDFLKTAAAGVGVGMLAARAAKADETKAATGPGAVGLKVPPLETVRIGFIGCGGRGNGHLGHYLKLEGCEIKAICDIHEPTARSRQQRCINAGRPAPTIYTKGDYDYRRMLERDDLDLVVVATPWRWHAPQVVEAMQAGKHAFCEVPIAYTVEDCWRIVDTAEKTQKHCVMMENVCYGREELMVLNMCRRKIFGELTHGECAYIHELRGQMRALTRGTGFWRTKHHETRNGNLYPTHGLGPIAQYMSINRGDQFAYLTSMSSPALGRAEYARGIWPPDHPRNQTKYICGDMNTSLIKTARGRTIMIQHDTTTPRPYDRINLIQGTRGCFRGYPDRVAVLGRGNTHKWQDLDKCYSDFDHPMWKRMGGEARKSGGHGGMDFLMNWRMIYCLRNGEPMDQDVYDGVSWSVIGPVSEQSVANRSAPVDIPDFTRGRWKTTPALGVVS